MATSRIRLELSEVEIAAIAQRVAAIIVSGGTQPRGDSPQRFLTPAEAAQYLRCSRQRIYDLCSAGTLSRFRDGLVFSTTAFSTESMAREAIARGD